MKPISLPALVLSAMLTAAALSSLAQPTQPLRPDQPARREIRNYVQQNVLPTLRQQRQKLEAQLSTSDKAQLAVYRAQLHDLRQQRHALRQSFGSVTTPAGSRPALTDAQQQQVQQLRTETRTLLLSVSQLAEKYNADIVRLAQELKPQKEKWAADIQALTSQHAGSAAAAHPRRHHRKNPLQRLFRPAAFLLLEPTEAASAVRPGAGSQVYPNPTATTTQLAYEVAKTGPVTVELLDGRGNTLRTVQPESRQEKGAHTLTLDVTDLPVGTYFFKVITRTGAEIKRFVKE